MCWHFNPQEVQLTEHLKPAYSGWAIKIKIIYKKWFGGAPGPNLFYNDTEKTVSISPEGFQLKFGNWTSCGFKKLVPQGTQHN